MSELYVSKKALHLLEQRLEKSKLPSHVRLFLVTSFPRSDMGKGTLVAHMLRMLDHSNAIKFDGLLNTNKNGRHTARGHDDFGIYEKYNSTKRFDDKNYILGGQLYQDFITKYGEYENLTFRPYMVKHFMATIQEMWRDIGKPHNLIVELGGTLTDFEVEPYVAPSIRELKNAYKGQAQVILLTETGYNNEYIKTKTVQDSVQAFVERMIIPDIIIAREPSELQDATLVDRIEFERTIRGKLEESISLTFQKILSVPFFTQQTIDTYGEFLDNNLLPLISPSNNYKKIFIGSHNPHKVADWKSYIGNKFAVTGPEDFAMSLDVPEGMISIRENSLAKAKAWCRLSGLPTIADDTGFYIHALEGAPGVAVKRWGGKLPESTTDEEFYNYMKNQVANLEDTSCYLETVLTIAFPDGEDYQITHQTAGYIDKTALQKEYEQGSFPLGLVFKKNGRDKVWAQMDDEEKRASDQDMVEKVFTLLQQKIS